MRRRQRGHRPQVRRRRREDDEVGGRGEGGRIGRRDEGRSGRSTPGSRALVATRSSRIRAAVSGEWRQERDRLGPGDERGERRPPGAGADDRDAGGASAISVAGGSVPRPCRAAACATVAFDRRLRGSLTEARSRKTSRIGVPSNPNVVAQPVLEVAPIREVDRRRVRCEEHERRRRDGRLRGVEQLGPLAADGRRRRPFGRRGEHAVQLAGRDAPAALAPRCRPPARARGRRAARSSR